MPNQEIMSDDEIFRKQFEEAYDWHKEGIRPGAELDWFAVDSLGHIACFMTSGFALVPKIVFREKKVLWEIYNFFYKEPSDYLQVRLTSSLMEYDVTHYAERGLYSFDNPSDIDKPYERIRAPKEPSLLSSLPFEFRQWLEPITFSSLIFSQTTKIDVSKYFECV